ncbi:MAG: TlpA disulfide reductase family protein [Pyrinomonadaceae bacterium]
MRYLLRNLTFFIFFSIVFSGLIACTKTATNPETTSDNSAVKKGSSDFPAVSPEIMQAAMTTADGKDFKLEDYKGKVVLVNLWGIWCPPCRAEMPTLVTLQNKYKEKGFEVIGLNVGDENAEKELPENIKSFGEKMKLNYTLAQSDYETFDNLLKLSGYGGVPQSFLIDREGRLNGVFTGFGPATPAKLDESVEKVLNAN